MIDDSLRVLAAHAEKYPLMQPCDAVKLLYQNTFGGGHLVADARESLLRLRAEKARVPFDAALQLYEDIGNGFARVQLAALREEVYPLEKLNRDFVRSAAAYSGTVQEFQSKLALLRDNLTALPFTFSRADLDAYLAEYAADGYPSVSHSSAYRAAYRPAYRVLRP